MSALNPMEAMQLAAGIGEALNNVTAELKNVGQELAANRERSDVLILVNNRVVVALEQIATLAPTIEQLANHLSQ